MNNPVKILVIGTIAYMIAGGIMKFADEYLGFWFGRKDGKLLWLVIALIISGPLEKLTSMHKAKELHRHVVVSDQIKPMNESIYYNVIETFYNTISCMGTVI